jgi:hypothetical protein
VHNKKRGESVALRIRPSLARVHDLSVVLLHECETACAATSASSAVYAFVSRPVPYTRHKRALYMYLREDGHQRYSDLFVPT